ncbi:MAG: hypothetical protein K5985_08960 [Lachnospiraceae bacterium]|nr:hypothetical protein [Lachnospiraceae bacterium]
MRKKKGEYGYLKTRRASSLIKALASLGFVVLLVVTGRFLLPAHKGIFNVCAVISAIPLAMAVVSFVMSLRFSSVPEEVFLETQKAKGRALMLYDCALTTRDRGYSVGALAILGKNLLALSPEKDGAEEITKHLEYMTKKSGFTGWGIKTHTSLSSFVSRLNELSEKDIKPVKEDETMRDFLLEIIL